jgi:arylsulfatase A-like enzyme
MDQPTSISRVIVVVLDGLRPDAIDAFHLHHIKRLMHSGAFTMRATTVSPSITTAAMTSLLTGVHPEIHGLRSDRLHIPSVHKQLFPIPRVLHDAGIPTFVFMRELPLLTRPFAYHIAWKLGVECAVFRGKTAPSILMEARHVLQTEPRGFFLLHWADADQAGHESGWMSDEYRDAAKKLDASLGLLCALTNVVNDPSTLLIALADHGGGGEVPTNHESTHPHDWTIPIMLCGGAVVRSRLDTDVSLVDVSPTILHALDVAIPSNYAGRPLTEAFNTPAYAIAS